MLNNKYITNKGKVNSLTHNQGVTGSSPVGPTSKSSSYERSKLLFYLPTYNLHTKCLKKALPKDSKNKNRPQKESGFKVIWRFNELHHNYRSDINTVRQNRLV